MIRAGSWSVTALCAERFRLDGGSMFGVVPKPLWSRSHPADERNRIEMSTRCLLASGEGRVVLVDTGLGGAWSDKERDIYAIENGPRSIVSVLAAAGVAAAEVTDVVLTHLHFDHVGGAIAAGAGGAVPAFPNAVHHVQESQLAWAQSPSEKDRRSYRTGDFLPLQKAGLLRPARGAREILPGIHVEPTEGHTIGHQIVRIGEGPGAVVHCGDLIPMAAHLPAPWVMGFDLHPMTTMKEKRALLERAELEGWILVMEHDPFVPAVRVRRDGEGFVPAEPVRGLE